MSQTNLHPSSHSSKYLPIEDYALIGDLHTVALVGTNGSIDWCCLPRFDSPSVFGALLDADKAGFFRIAPSEMEQVKCRQIYLPETNILLTRFLSVDGVAELTDFMPVKQVGTAPHHHQIIRSITVVHGSLSFTLVCQPAFNYARDTHRVELSEQGVSFQHASFRLALVSPVPLKADEHGGVQATFTLHSGEAMHFLLESTEQDSQAPQALSEEAYQTVF
ncbi:MAG TPA: trehalase-like domain-containing protein, partial [Ktedonobacteraceae bacterium]